MGKFCAFVRIDDLVLHEKISTVSREMVWPIMDMEDGGQCGGRGDLQYGSFKSCSLS